MSEKPIPFSGEMVRAILDGNKTQTRRVIKSQPRKGCDVYYNAITNHFIHDIHACCKCDGYNTPITLKCPYAVGDVLWVRETWLLNGSQFGKDLRLQFKVGIERPHDDRFIGYLIKIHAPQQQNKALEIYKKHPRKWRPPMFMPRWAARLFLKVKSVKVERVQDISIPDAMAEGIEVVGGPASCNPYRNYLKGKKGEINIHCSYPIRSFQTLWDSINEKRGYGWDKNPYVWVYEFERINHE